MYNEFHTMGICNGEKYAQKWILTYCMDKNKHREEFKPQERIFTCHLTSELPSHGESNDPCLHMERRKTLCLSQKSETNRPDRSESI
jgi:hypothetical protein